MFGLVSSLVGATLSEQDPPYRILFLGLDGAGKTTLIHAIRNELSTDAKSSTTSSRSLSTGQNQTFAFLSDKPKSSAAESSELYAPTVGLECFSVRVSVLGRSETWDLWDLGGDVSLRFLWHRYLHHADAVVWVVDGSDTARQTECIAALDDMGQHLALDRTIVSAETGPVDHGNKFDSSPSKRPLLIAINRLDTAEYSEDAARWADALMTLIEGVTSRSKVGPSALQHIDARTGYGIRGVIGWLAANRPSLSDDRLDSG
ncbi:ADP-ribosylation factor protein 3 [Cyanidiococcus yangmingshanensis]|uniref:ADP-ribosylation factor protein 3 n=1 Tax=Cyanidiococcus yangmingshanensis TaxID=2690220 RepID=A0A7J7IPY6_9RHOD|nr:ADP-ribosylation factor protein 3 [Cyanidiococcus yangmingshanensis]